MKRWLPFLVLLLPSISFGTAYTSSGSGNWGSASTWGGAGVPGNNDTAVISNGNVVTSTFSVIVGTSPAGGSKGQIGTDAVKIVGTGQLVISTGMFTLRGDVEITATGNITLQAGTTIQLDSSQATNPFAQEYRIFTSGTSGNDGYTPLISNCSATAGCWVISNAGGGNGYIDGGEFTGAYYGGGITAAYTNFVNIGDSTNTLTSVWTNASSPTGNDWNVQNSTFTGCGLINFLTIASGQNVIHKHNYHTASAGSFVSGAFATGVIRLSAAGSNSATEEISNNVFDQQIGGVGNTGGGMDGFNIHDNYFGNGILGASGIWSAFTNNMIRGNFNGPTVVPGMMITGNAISNYWIADNYRSLHVHFPDISPHVTDVLISSNIWDSTYVSQVDSNDGITEAGVPSTNILSYNIGLCGSAVNVGQILWSMRAVSNSTWTITHNTACPGEGGTVGTYQDAFTPNMVDRGSMENNIWFDTVNNLTNYAYMDTSISGDSDTFSPSQILNNDIWNLAQTDPGYASSSQANSYIAFWNSTPGTSDVHTDPQFVDNTRNFVTFDAAYLNKKGLAPNSTASWSVGGTFTAGEIISDSSSTYFNNSFITYRCILSTANAQASIEPGVGVNYATYFEFASAYDIRMAVASNATITDSTLGFTNATYIQALLAWVTAGYSPTNPLLHNAATDGTDIGAVPFTSTTTGTSSIAAWANDEGDKIPRECWYPHCVNYSSSTLSRYWNGTSATPFSAEGQLAHFQIIAYDSGTVDASSVTVAMSSFTCSGGTGIANTVQATSMTVTSFVGRPIRVYSAWYIPNLGLSYFPFNVPEYEERQLPIDMRVPCTVNGNGQCAPDDSPGTGTWLWTNRTMHNMSLPMTWIPNEEFAPVATSSYTIYHSSSMSFDVDVWVSSSIPAGTCNGTFSLYQGTTLSTAVPVAMKVYSVQMPQTTGMPVIAFTDVNAINKRMQTGSPPVPATGVYLAARQAAAQALKENGIQIEGDNPDLSTNNFFSLEYSSYVSGGAFTPAVGYANAPGIGVGNKQYIIDFYGNGLDFEGGTQSQFCLNVSSWIAGCGSENCILYTPEDEGSLELLETVVSSITFALQNNPSCSVGGKTLPLMQTASLVDVSSVAPYAAYTNTAGWFNSTNGGWSSGTWQTDATTIMTGAGPTGALGQVWGYNDNPFDGAIYPYEEEGYVPEAGMWQMWLKICQPNGGVCKGGKMLWHVDAWTGPDVGGRYFCGMGGLGGGSNGNLDLMHNPCTFGEAYSTSTSLGMIGNPDGESYSQGNGTMLYPGTDVFFSSASFGFNGVTEGYILKEFGRGVDDINLLNMAYAVNPSSTTTLARQMVTNALWETACFNSSACQANPSTCDCSYAYGDRSWEYGANNWALAREALMEIITGAPVVNPTNSVTFQGNFTWRGQ